MLLVLLTFPFVISSDTSGYEHRVVAEIQCVFEDNCQSSTDLGGVDPRSSAIICPPGQMACSISDITCGQRRTTNYNRDNGISTPSSHPWQAYITYFGQYIASGTLLDSTRVLTAAHKVFHANPWTLHVFLGVWDPNNLDRAQIRTVNTVTIHPAFNNDTLKCDVAVLHLTSPVIFDEGIGSACLPLANQIFTNRVCTVAGWGETSFGAKDAGTTVQRQVNLRVVDDARCRRSMKGQNVNTARYLDANGEICAGGESGLDACTQDGGAPLICFDSDTDRYTVAGIVIWGKGCGQPDVYGVYTNVAYYRNWIDTTL